MTGLVVYRALLMRESRVYFGDVRQFPAHVDGLAPSLALSEAMMSGGAP